MKVGSLVLCVQAESNGKNSSRDVEVLREYNYVFPEFGEMYVVRGVMQYEGNMGIWLEEIVNPPVPFSCGGYGEIAWSVENFREIQPPMTINIEELISEPQTLEHATF